MGIKEVMFKKIVFRMPTKHDVIHHGHTAAHMTYLGAVFHEAHGFYGYAAGVLLVIIMAGLFVGEEL